MGKFEAVVKVSAGEGVEWATDERIQLEYFSPNDLRLWAGNPKIRRGRRNADIERSLRTTRGFAVPIIGVRRRSRIIIADGNRRLRIAQKIGIPKVPVLVVDSRGLTVAQLAVMLNTTGAKWTARELIQMFLEFDTSISTMQEHTQRLILGFKELVGEKDFRRLGEAGVGDRAYRHSTQFIRQAAEKPLSLDADFQRKLVLWMCKHKQIGVVAHVLHTNYTAQFEEIIDAVKQDRMSKIRA
jgi:hypothetical protein